MAVEFFSNGYDTTETNPYTEVPWADAHPSIGLARYGVRSPGDWKVTAVSGADRTVSIAAGRGFGHGVTDKTVANDTIQLDPITSGSRWDLIACRRDWTPTGGTSQFIKVNGGSSPVIPGGRLVGPGNMDDQPLFLVQVTNGQTQPTGFIDLRIWAGDGGGLLAKDPLVLTYLNATGTQIHINGIDWIRRMGANDIPEWFDPAALGTTTVPLAATGWTNVSTALPARVEKRNGIGFLNGYVLRANGTNPTITTIPAGYRPTNDVTFDVVSRNGPATGADELGPTFRIYIDASTGSVIANRLGVTAPVWANGETRLPISAAYPLA